METDKEIQSSKIAKILLILASILVIMGVFIIAIEIDNKNPSPKALTPTSFVQPSDETPQETLIKEVIISIKEETSFPVQIDSITTWTDMTSSGNIIYYDYKINDVNTESLTSQSFKDYIAPEICKNPELRFILDNDIILVYRYKDIRGIQAFIFTVTKEDC